MRILMAAGDHGVYSIFPYERKKLILTGNP